MRELETKAWTAQTMLYSHFSEQFAEPDEESPLYRLRSDHPIKQHCPCCCTLCSAGAGARRNPALLLPAPATANDRRGYWPVTQHSGTAYPVSLASAARWNGGIPVWVSCSSMKLCETAAYRLPVQISVWLPAGQTIETEYSPPPAWLLNK